MGIRSTLSSLLSAPMAPLLEARVRELVDAALEARDLANPAEVRELSTGIERARRAVDELRAEVVSCRDALAALPADDEQADELTLRVAGLSAQDEALAEQVTAVQQRLSALGDQVVALRSALEAAPAAQRPAAAEAHRESPPPAPTAEGDKGCKVPGCANAHRARGFCARHYQMWKRSTLPGFVGPEGAVSFEGTDRQWKVDPALAGEPAERGARGIKVGGRRVASEPVA